PSRIGPGLGDRGRDGADGVGLGGQADGGSGGQERDDETDPRPHATSRSSTANDKTSCTIVPASSLSVLDLRARSASAASRRARSSSRALHCSAQRAQRAAAPSHLPSPYGRAARGSGSSNA